MIADVPLAKPSGSSAYIGHVGVFLERGLVVGKWKRPGVERLVDVLLRSVFSFAGI